MKLLRVLRPACLWGARTAGLFALWTLWLALIVLLGIQVKIAVSHELVLPGFAKTALQRHFAAVGLRVDFSRALLDPAGRVQFEDVSVGDPALPGLLATAHALYAEFNPWALAAGSLELRELQVSGAKLLANEEYSDLVAGTALVSELNFTLQPQGRILAIPALTAHFGGTLPDVSLSGALSLPKGPSAPADPATLVRMFKQYAGQLSKAPSVLAQFAVLSDIDQTQSLTIHLQPDDDKIATVTFDWANSKGAGAAGETPSFTTGPFHVHGSFPLQPAPGTPLTLTGEIADLYSRFGEFTCTATFRVRAEWQGGSSPLVFRQLEASAGGVTDTPRGDLRTKGTPLFDAATATLTQHAPSSFTIDADAFVTGVPWSIRYQQDQKSGRLTLAGPVTNAILTLASRFTGRDLGTIVQLTAPARVSANVTFAITPENTHEFVRAEGELTAGAARVAGVPLDGAAAQVTYDGRQLRCDHGFLRVGDSVARGSYEMDTSTLDFRILLAGRLRPPAIDPWLGAWWPEFWRSFAFPAAPPEAEVDVRGRWFQPESTAVFVAADAPGAVVRGLAFDRVRTTLFVRPGWYDVLAFSARQGEHEARGGVILRNEPGTDRWRQITFNVASDLELDPAAGLFGADGRALVAPYHFARPPSLQLTGQLDGQSDRGWKQATTDIAVAGPGDFTFGGFPLSDLTAQVRLRDDIVDLPVLAVGFAGGRAEGHARIMGAPTARRLAYGATLKDADLGAAIQAVENFIAARHPEATAPGPKPKHLTGGKLGITLAAEGALDDKFNYNGAGTAGITGADFGQINLLGLLSELLNHTLLNFTSLSLDTLQANFTVAGNQLAFSELHLSGPRAALDAKGAYLIDRGSLDFTAKISPFKESSSVLGNAIDLMTKPLSGALEVKLDGTLNQPSWVFVYGPTNFLRKLTGDSSPPGTPAPPAASKP